MKHMIYTRNRVHGILCCILFAWGILVTDVNAQNFPAEFFPNFSLPCSTPVPVTMTDPILYSQLQGNTCSSGSFSEDYVPAQDANDSQTADDFVVPGGAAWNISQVEVIGGGGGLSFTNGPWDIFFYNDNSGSPGTLNQSRLNVVPTVIPPSNPSYGSFLFDFASDVSLGPGTYWISVVGKNAELTDPLSNSRRFIWDLTDNPGSGVNGNQAYARNPGGSILPACTAWSPGGGCYGVGVFDVQFALGGKDANAPIANLKVFLQGPHNPNVAAAMFTTLNSAGQLPLTQPYKNDLYNGTPLDYDGNETVSVMPANIVDWVLVELRTGTAANTKIAMQAALLRDDGVVVDAGGGTVAFNNVVWDNYYLVVRHRNHIPIISFTGVPLTNASAQWDFTAAAGLALGSTQIELSAGLFGMYGGDANLDGSVAYVGAARDQLGVINLLGTENLSDLQTNLYNNSDMNLNNEIRYIGNGRDQSVIITALGTDNLGDVITSAVPE